MPPTDEGGWYVDVSGVGATAIVVEWSFLALTPGLGSAGTPGGLSGELIIGVTAPSATAYVVGKGNVALDVLAVSASGVPGNETVGPVVAAPSPHAESIAGVAGQACGVLAVAVFAAGYPAIQSSTAGGSIDMDVAAVEASASPGGRAETLVIETAGVQATGSTGGLDLGSMVIVYAPAVGATGDAGGSIRWQSLGAVAVLVEPGAFGVGGAVSLDAPSATGFTSEVATTLGGAYHAYLGAVLASGEPGAIGTTFPADVFVVATSALGTAGAVNNPSIVYPDPFAATSSSTVNPFTATSAASVNPFASASRPKGS